MKINQCACLASLAFDILVHFNIIWFIFFPFWSNVHCYWLYLELSMTSTPSDYVCNLQKLYERWRATVGVACAKAEVSHRKKITMRLVTKPCLELLPKSFCVELRWESARLHFVTVHVALESITMRVSTRGVGGVCSFHHPEDSCFIPSIAVLTVAGRRLVGRHTDRNLSHSSHSGFI